MLRRSNSEVFPIDGHEFNISGRLVTAEVANAPDLSPGDAVPFILKFSNGKQLKLTLSETSLRLDVTGAYREEAFRIVETWLSSDPPSAEIEYFG
jgi:hypothetical protein